MSLVRGSVRRSVAGGIILGGLAWALLAVHIGLMLGAPSTYEALVVTMAIPLILVVILCVGALCIYYYELDDLALRISAWTLVGVVVFSVVLGGVVVHLQSHLSAGISMSMVFVNVASSGAVMGFVIGLYHAYQQRLLVDLQAEYDRTVGLSQRLSVLARILRHDLRNQLTVIIGQADRLERRDLSPEAANAVSEIDAAGEELASICENIGQFSSILEKPHPDQSVFQIDLAGTIDDVVDGIRSRHGSDSVRIETSVPDGVSVEASPFLPKALDELLENAIIHNDAQKPRVGVRVEPETDAEGRIEVWVTDNGPGIPRDEVTVHNSEIETQLDHSIGVGLWLVRWVIDASDGEIDFETDTDDGTAVRIRLPEADQSRSVG